MYIRFVEQRSHYTYRIVHKSFDTPDDAGVYGTLCREIVHPFQTIQQSGQATQFDKFYNKTVRRCSQCRFQTVDLFRPRPNFFIDVGFGILELKEK